MRWLLLLSLAGCCREDSLTPEPCIDSAGAVQVALVHGDSVSWSDLTCEVTTVDQSVTATVKGTSCQSALLIARKGLFTEFVDCPFPEFSDGEWKLNGITFQVVDGGTSLSSCAN